MRLVGSIIPHFDSQVTLRRFFPGYSERGVWKDLPPEETRAMMSVQPSPSRDLLLLPEGLRTRETKRFYSRCLVRTADVGGKHQADEIDYRGTTYEVQQVTDWEELGGYYRAIAVKKGQ